MQGLTCQWSVLVIKITLTMVQQGMLTTKKFPILLSVVDLLHYDDFILQPSLKLSKKILIIQIEGN